MPSGKKDRVLDLEENGDVQTCGYPMVDLLQSPGTWTSATRAAPGSEGHTAQEQSNRMIEYRS